MADASSSAVAGRRQGAAAEAKAAADAGPTAGRRRAADGSELAGGRKDAPSGWGEETTGKAFGIGRRPALESGDASAALKIGGDDEVAAVDKVWNRNKFNEKDKEEEATILQEVPADEASSPHVSAAAPRNVAGRKVQTLQELAQQEAAARLGGAGAGRSGAATAAVLTGVDLSLLTAVLSPPDALEEPDVPWQFDRMLQEVSQVCADWHAELSYRRGGCGGVRML